MGPRGGYASHPSAILRDGEDSILYVGKARIHPQWPRKPCMLSWRDVRHGGVLMDESRKEGKGVGMRNRHHVREDLPTASCLCRGTRQIRPI
jgi:hypothetical protein